MIDGVIYASLQQNRNLVKTKFKYIPEQKGRLDLRRQIKAVNFYLTILNRDLMVYKILAGKICKQR